MGKSVRNTSPQKDIFDDSQSVGTADPPVRGVGSRTPIKAQDIFSDSQEADTDSFFANPSVKSSIGEMQFSPADFPYVKDPTPFGDVEALDIANRTAQPTSEKWARGFKMAGVNALSSFGQTLASTFDLVAAAHTAGSLLDNKANDDFSSGIFGITDTEEIAKWAKGIQERNVIYENNPGSFSPGDAGWWTNEILPQMGTLVGTAVGALATTAAIEGLTDGTGTGVAAANLLKTMKNFWGAAKSGEIIAGGLDLAKGMKGAAAMYASISRYSEARFEAQNNYDNTYERLSNTLKPDGTPYTEEEKKHYASEGAKVDFGLTVGQLPIDLLFMRAMIFNPLEGSATGWLDKNLEKVAESFGEGKVGKIAGKYSSKVIGAGAEGLISGAIPIFQKEGEHHANVLAGLESPDESTLASRLSEGIGSGEFGTMVASGVLGGLLIGPSMEGTKKLINKNREQTFNNKYQEYVNDVVPSLSSLANRIVKADTKGDTELAAMGRRYLNSSRAIDAVHLDNMAGKSNMFDAHINYLQTTLDQANNGQATNIQDLTGTATPEQIEKVKAEFQTYMDDANEIKDLYNKIGQRYNRNFVPTITTQHFNLNRLLESKAKVDANINTALAGFTQYNMLSPQGKQLHELGATVDALEEEKNKLTLKLTTVSNEFERENIKKLLDVTKNRMTVISKQVDTITNDPSYDADTKDADNDIVVSSQALGKDYQKAVNDREFLNNSITLQRKDLALWENSKYHKAKVKESIKNAKTTEQVGNNVFADPDGKIPADVAAAMQATIAKIEAKKAADLLIPPGTGNEDLFKEEKVHTESVADGVKKMANNTEEVVPTPETESTTASTGNPENISPTVELNVNTPEVKSKDVVNERNVLQKELDFEIKYSGSQKPETFLSKLFLGKRSKYADEIKKDIKALDENPIKYFKKKLEETLAYNKKNPNDPSPVLAKKYGDILDRLERQKSENVELPGDGTDNNADNISYEPLDYDMENSPQEAKDQIKRGVAGLLAQLPADASFEDLVRHVIRVRGLKFAEDNFKGWKYGWEANGKPEIDYDAEYQKIFGNPFDSLNVGFSQLVLNTPEKVKGANEKNQADAIAKDGQADGVDNNNQPIYVFIDEKGKQVYVTRETSAKGAFSTFTYINIKKNLGDGTIQTYWASDGELTDKNNGFVSSLINLDPDRVIAGTKTTIRIPEKINDVIIGVFSSDKSSYEKFMPFGQWVSEQLDKNKMSLEEFQKTQIYKDKVPMVHYLNDNSNGDKGIFFVHDVEWYAPPRFSPEAPNALKEAIANTRRIREEVLANHAAGKGTPSTITGKRQTTFSYLNSEGSVTLREGNPEAVITIGSGGEFPSARDSKGSIAFPSENARIINKNPLLDGSVVEWRRFGTDKDGVPTYIGNYADRENLGAEAIQSIIQAITIYDNKLNLTKAQKEVVDHIKETMGADVDITQPPSEAVPSGLKAYLAHFINMDDKRLFGRKDTSEQVEALAKANLAYGTPYMSFIKGGNLVFGQAGKPAYIDSRTGQPVWSLFVNPNHPGSSTSAIMNLNKTITVGEGDKEKTVSRLAWYEHNVSLDMLAANDGKGKPIVLIDRNNTTSVAAPTYRDYLLDHLRTTIKSINIGTEEKPIWVTNIQPVITYDTDKNLSNAITPPIQVDETNKKEIVKPDIVSPDGKVGEEVNKEEGAGEEKGKEEKVVEDTPEEAMRKAQDYMNKALGKDKGISNSLLLEPNVINDTQTEYLASSIDRINGLDPRQQDAIVRFITNQIFRIASEGREGGIDIGKEIDDILDRVLEPQKTESLEAIAFGEDFLTKFPAQQQNLEFLKSLEDLRYKVAAIDSIKAQSKALKNIAYTKIRKYDGLTINKQVLEREEGKTNTNDDDVLAAREVDFWTDILTESAEKKVSYALRRFFEETRVFNTKGEAQTGFLNLDLYMDGSAVVHDLMTMLANVPADFKTMMDVLGTRREAAPWIGDVIDRLNNASEQIRNQFVTSMNNTNLVMKKSQLGYDRKTKTWYVRMIDETTKGIAGVVKQNWSSNLFGDNDFNLIRIDENGNKVLNMQKAETLLNRFRGWVGEAIPILESDVTPIRPAISQVRVGQSVTTEIKGDSSILTELKKHLVEPGDRARFTLATTQYQISHIGGDKYKISFLAKANYKNNQEVADWLREFGIVLSPGALRELMTKGLYHNVGRRTTTDLFRTDGNGLLGTLYLKLKSAYGVGEKYDLNEYGNGILDDSVVTSLANLEAEHSDIKSILGFRVAGKHYSALVMDTFISDRANSLKEDVSSIRDNLRQISFSQNSFILRLLEDSDFRSKYQVSDDSAESIAKIGKNAYKAANLSSLSDMDHELSKLTKFWATLGDVRYGKNKLNKYPGSTIALRLATMFGLTMSDKDRMKLFTTAVLNLNTTYLKDGLHKEVVAALYNETVKPELLRMIKHAQITRSGAEPSNIEGYDEGAGIFHMIPEMNDIMVNPTLKLVDAIKQEPFEFNATYIENNPDIKKEIDAVIKTAMDKLVEEKLAVWDKNNYTIKDVDKDGKEYIKEIRFFPSKYLSKFSGTNEEKLRMAAMDFEVNNLISNAQEFMLFAGDPATFFKSKSTDYKQQAIDTYDNINKRLAMLIAPRAALPGSVNEKYLQIFMADRLATADNINHLEELLGKENAKAYRDIKVADAQEFTTWKEHLDILNRMGKTADYMYDITPEDISRVRKILLEGKKKAELSEKDMQVLLKVMQPIKPVYTGQMYDKDQDVMRNVYIKSSSFPLYAQLTEGREIDKLRLRMDKLQKNTGKNVRASFQSANKLGALKLGMDSTGKPVALWKEDGTIDDDVLKNLGKYTLELDRSHFGIQQEVPFKSDTTKADLITIGSQLVKELFGDGMMNETGFEYDDVLKALPDHKDGEPFTGKELQKVFTRHFINLVNEKQQQLFDELGLDEKGVPRNTNKALEKLQRLLKKEAKDRGYPLQDIKGLEINRITGDFVLPLWISSNSNRYESMLNSIVSKRIIAMKLPGAGLITGSEEGFRTKVKEEGDLTPEQRSQMIFTDAWNGISLQPDQVFVPSKFRDNEGNLIDLLEFKDGKYTYVEDKDGKFKLKTNMFDKELLSNMSFRIPTAGHQMGSLVDIAGFLPHTSANLVIVGKNTVVQKGLDFDIDKENTYQLWTHIDEKTGKIEALSNKHQGRLLDNVMRLINDAKILKAEEKLEQATNSEEYQKAKIAAFNARAENILGDLGLNYSDEEINREYLLKKANSKFKEKLIQNEIIKVHKSVYANTKDSVQAKIKRPLSTKFAEEEADYISGLVSQSEPTKRSMTMLSSEFQKKSLMAGASSTVGRGSYSLDVTFHSLVQQALIDGKPLEFNTTFINEQGLVERLPKIWGFGSKNTDGKLGGFNTIDGGRSRSEALSEAQSIAVDNASLRNILGKLNLNELTFDVHKMFLLQGIDKGEDGHSIPFLFMSQPIIRKYVEMMQNANSIFADYEQNKEDKVVTTLLQQYDPKTSNESIDDSYWATMSEQMSNKNMINAISSQTPDGKLQGAILRRFVEMRQYGLAIRSVQATVNFKNNGLGKSFFDVIDKKEALNRLGYDNIVKVNGEIVGRLSGASGLLGDYILKENIETPEEGYIDIGDYYVKPTTVQGAISVNAITTAYNLWGKYFPYDTGTIKGVFNEIIPLTINPEIVNKGGTVLVEAKQKIFQNIKKFLAANKMNGLLSSKDDVNAERARLYIDTETNVSLTKYVKNLMQTYNDPIIDRYIKTNPLLLRLQAVPQKDGTPSTLKYNNAQGEEFDEQYLYESLTQLLIARDVNGNRIALPTLGNKSYTLDTLAQDLIAYCYLGNAIQEATQFTKYVPVAYLNTVGYSEWLRNGANLGLKNTNNTENSKHLISEYGMQYIQHFPESIRYRLETAGDNESSKFNDVLKQVVEPTYSGEKPSLDTLESFHLLAPDRPTFITIYNTNVKADKKQQLYWLSDGEKYVRLPILGTFGMDEYQPGVGGHGQTIVNDRVGIKELPQEGTNNPPPESAIDRFDINGEHLPTILKNVAEANISGMSELAAAIAPYVKDIKIMYRDDMNARGQYNSITNEIGVNRQLAAKSPSYVVARTILHETIHALTKNQVAPYITQNADGSVDVKSNAPAYVTKLVRLYNEVRSKEDPEELARILAKARTKDGLTQAEVLKYGMTTLDEFMTAATTREEFQQYLDKAEFKQSGQTLLERFKEVIKNILSAVGVTFDSDSAATHAIDSIFELITEANKDKISPEYKKMAEDALSEDTFYTDEDYNGWIDPRFDEEKPRVTVKVNTGASWTALKNMPVYTEYGVNTMRTYNKESMYSHFGNPFSESGVNNTIKVPTVGAAVQAYKDWLLTDKYNNVNSKQKQWILEQINSGKLDNATLLYDRKLAERGLGTHAHALAEVVKELRGNKSNMNNMNTFQGYKGGFDSTGKGTPQGDGKDKAMRKVADGFIGELKNSYNGKTSSNTSYEEIAEKVKSNRLTSYGTPHTNLSNAKLVMLARNAEFSRKELDKATKDLILEAHNNGANFVVGDMPGVDSQFIDYLQEIGAKFTVYHTGKESRIKVQDKNNTDLEPDTQPFPTKDLNIKDEKCI